MQDYTVYAQSQAGTQTFEVSKVLRNTYALLAMTLVFSAIMAFVGMQLRIHIPLWMYLVGAYGLMFLTSYLRNSVLGIVSTFAFTGFMGLSLSMILNFYFARSGGAELVITALGMTALVFCGLSGYVLTTRKDMSFLSGFITAGAIVLILAMVLGFFTDISGLGLAISAGFVLFSSAAILWQTSEIIHGGERNYIMATISLYVSIYNIFVSLLHLLGAFSGDD